MVIWVADKRAPAAFGTAPDLMSAGSTPAEKEILFITYLIIFHFIKFEDKPKQY